MRLYVPDLATAGQDLNLLASGSALARAPPRSTGLIKAGNDVLLQVGDNVSTTDPSRSSPADLIAIYGDYGNADPGVGTMMDLRGSITPGTGASDQTQIFGNADNDTFTFNQTFLGGQTFAYGSNAPSPAGSTAPPGDGQDPSSSTS